MSLPVAIRSAVFYFVACTPCAKVRHRQKARTQAKKERLEKAKVIAEQPDLYQHPSPFNTNPYWQEEIDIGPSLPKKTNSKNSSQRGLNSSGKESDVPSVSSHTNVADSRTNFGSSNTVIPEEDGLSDDWNKRKGYQREDEELWGQWSGSGHKIMDAFSKARDSAGRAIESALGFDKEVTDQERREFYFSPKVPPVNDYHPPVVSNKAPHPNVHKWMLQPPPSAKIMEGKVPVTRAYSSSSRSSGLSREEIKLGRLVNEKLAMERVKKEADPTETELIESLFTTRTNRPLSMTRGRSLSFDACTEELFNDKRRGSLRPNAVPPGAESDDDEMKNPRVIRPLSTAALHPLSTNGYAARRPKLETIASQGSDSSNYAAAKMPKKQRPTRGTTLSGQTSPVGDDTD